MNFDLAVAYHCSLPLVAAFTQPMDHLLAEPYTYVATAPMVRLRARARARGHFLGIRLVRNSNSNVAACARVAELSGRLLC